MSYWRRLGLHIFKGLNRKLHATQTIGNFQEIQGFYKGIKCVGVSGQVGNRPDIHIHFKAVNTTQIERTTWLIHLRAVQRKTIGK